jgi:hypothetical protein
MQMLHSWRAPAPTLLFSYLLATLYAQTTVCAQKLAKVELEDYFFFGVLRNGHNNIFLYA